MHPGANGTFGACYLSTQSPGRARGAGAARDAAVHPPRQAPAAAAPGVRPLTLAL